MGVASKKYCKTTPVKKMGFSQKASCRAQGIIPRASKKNKGKYLKSPKYKKKKYHFSRSKSINKSLYASGNKKPKIKTGYGTAQKAKMTLKNIKGKDKGYQLRIVNTMYNRAKYHKYQNQGMRDAMKIFKKWLDKQK